MATKRSIYTASGETATVLVHAIELAESTYMRMSVNPALPPKLAKYWEGVALELADIASCLRGMNIEHIDFSTFDRE